MATSDPCGPGRGDDDLRGYHNCPSGDGQPDFSFFWRHPGKPYPGSPESKPDRMPGISRGFNFGVVLLPYTRDWGLKVGVMRRKKAYATILHSFGRKTDRAYAMVSAENFIPKKDNFKQPIAEHLIAAKPFAGYTWQAKPLMQWLYFAQLRANELGAPNSLDALGAGDAAVAWCTGDVRAVWDILTREAFPYSPSDLIEYWRALPGPNFPGALPVPADVDAPP